MITKTLYTVLTLLVFTGCSFTAEAGKDRKSFIHHKGGTRYKESGRASCIFEYYKDENGKMVKHGKEVYYYDLPKVDGARVINSVQDWKHGLRDGLYTERYPNGIIMKSGRYVSGKKDGKWLHFKETGELVKEETYIKGKLDEETSNAKGNQDPVP